MPRFPLRLASSAALLLPLAAGAAVRPSPAGPIEVQRSAEPALLLHGPQRLPLDRQHPPAPGDRVATGASGRATLRFLGMTAVTLGDESDLLIQAIEPARPPTAPILRLQLYKGVLRLAVPYGGPESATDLRLSLGDLQLRTLSAELWVENAAAARSVCLLSGAVELTHPSGNQRLDIPNECLVYGLDGRSLRAEAQDGVLARELLRTVYADEISPRDRAGAEAAAALPQLSGSVPPVAAAVTAAAAPATVKPAEAAPVAAKASVPPAKVPAKVKGWTLVAASLVDAESARAEVKGLVADGLPARLRPYTGPDGTRLYRVTIGGYKTRDQAAAMAKKLRRSKGMEQLWVAPY